MQIQTHLGLPATSPHVHARAVAVPPPANPAPPPLASKDPLDMLAVAEVTATPPAVPQPIQVEDDSS